MRKGWEYKKLGEVGTFLRGKNILKSDFVEKGLPCIHYGQIHTKFGISTDTHLTETSQEVYNKAIIASKNDVLIAITSEDLEGSCKATAWLGDYDVAVSAHAAVFKHSLNPKYIVYYLKSQSFYIEKSKYARGFKVMEIKPTDIAKIPIPIPPKSTQLAIVSELDKINELIRLKKEQLKDSDNLAQSLFYEMFGDPVENEKGWEVKKLNNICDVRDGTHDSPKYLQNSEYILITSKNIVNGSIDFENVNYISEEDYIKINKRSKVDNGDIIMPMIGTIGNPIIAHIDGTHKFCIKNVALIKFLADSTVNNMFIVNLMRCSSFSSYLLNQNKGGTQKFVALGAIRKLPIPLPPLPLQHLFAQRIEQIEHQKAEVQKAITDLETLLASRMQYWFE